MRVKPHFAKFNTFSLRFYSCLSTLSMDKDVFACVILPTMFAIPQFIIQQMYVSDSLRQTDEGVAFDVQNSLAEVRIASVTNLTLNDTAFEPHQLLFMLDGQAFAVEEMPNNPPMTIPVGSIVTCVVKNADLAAGPYQVTLDLISLEGGPMSITVQDELSA